MLTLILPGGMVVSSGRRAERAVLAAWRMVAWEMVRKSLPV
jgi:hypothetical protein